jgi:hypothetical protein
MGQVSNVFASSSIELHAHAAVFKGLTGRGYNVLGTAVFKGLTGRGYNVLGTAVF